MRMTLQEFIALVTGKPLQSWQEELLKLVEENPGVKLDCLKGLK